MGVKKKGGGEGVSIRSLLLPLVNPRPATVATTIQSMQLSSAVTSPPLLSNPYPQQDILRLAGIQCQHLLGP